jgi:hypothetical protein
MTFLALVAIIVVLFGAAEAFSSFHMAKLRRSGRYPERGKATMGDVERLLKTGSPVWAVRCYREIHGCSLRQANEAVRALSTK